MSTQSVRSIKLFGEDSINFANSLFRPTTKEIIEKRECLKNLNDSVTIHKKEDGFEAEIEGLDLSFLLENKKNDQVSIEVTMKIRKKQVFYSSIGSKSEVMMVTAKVTDMFIDRIDDEIYCAA